MTLKEKKFILELNEEEISTITDTLRHDCQTLKSRVDELKNPAGVSGESEARMLTKLENELKMKKKLRNELGNLVGTFFMGIES